MGLWWVRGNERGGLASSGQEEAERRGGLALG